MLTLSLVLDLYNGEMKKAIHRQYKCISKAICKSNVPQLTRTRRREAVPYLTIGHRGTWNIDSPIGTSWAHTQYHDLTHVADFFYSYQCYALTN